MHKPISKFKMHIPGVKPSISNNQLLISTGIPTLDIIIGGGLPIGSIMVIEEDEGACYSGHMIKYFVAEGVVTEHDIFFASLEGQIDEIKNNLPSLVNYEKNVEEKEIMNAELTIAWRYANNSPKATAASTHFSHYFDQNVKMTTEQLKDVTFIKYPEQDEIMSSSDHLDKLIAKLDSYLSLKNFKTLENHRPSNVLRIVIQSFGSVQWWCPEDGTNFGDKLCHFLILLKRLVRSSYSSVVLTFPAQLYPDYIVSRLRNIVDFVVKLESFEVTKKENQTFKDYQGLFNLVKLPHLNSLVTTNESDHSDLAFRLRRKRFTIEKLHLPPIFSEDVKETTPTLGCSSNTNNKLEF